MFKGVIEVTKDLTFPDWFGGEDHILEVGLEYPLGPANINCLKSQFAKYLISIPLRTGGAARRYINRDLLREWFRKGYIKII